MTEYIEHYPEIVQICETCKHYDDFNHNASGAYMGEGFCKLLKEPRDPIDGCNKFYCHYMDSIANDDEEPVAT